MTETIVFNEQLVKQWTPLIHKMAKSIGGYNTSDMYYDYDDLFQVGLMALHEATVRYNPDLNTKFGTFLQTMLFSRLGSIGNKFKDKNFLTTNFSSIPGGWGTIGTEIDDEDSSSPCGSRRMKSSVDMNTVDISNQILDAKIAYARMDTDRKKIYMDYFILGKTVKEIETENPELKYYQIRRTLKYLKPIHATLVEGTQCLKN